MLSNLKIASNKIVPYQILANYN